MLDRDQIDTERSDQRTQGDAGNQITQHRAEPEARGDRHRDHAGDEEDEGQQQKSGHVVPRTVRVSSRATLDRSVWAVTRIDRGLIGRAGEDLSVQSVLHRPSTPASEAAKRFSSGAGIAQW